MIPVEIDGQVVYRVLTDDAVTRWASEKLCRASTWMPRTRRLRFPRPTTPSASCAPSSGLAACST